MAAQPAPCAAGPRLPQQGGRPHRDRRGSRRQATTRWTCWTPRLPGAEGGGCGGCWRPATGAPADRFAPHCVCCVEGTSVCGGGILGGGHCQNFISTPHKHFQPCVNLQAAGADQRRKGKGAQGGREGRWRFFWPGCRQRPHGDRRGGPAVDGQGEGGWGGGRLGDGWVDRPRMAKVRGREGGWGREE